MSKQGHGNSLRRGKVISRNEVKRTAMIIIPGEGTRHVRHEGTRTAEGRFISLGWFDRSGREVQLSD